MRVNLESGATGVGLYPGAFRGCHGGWICGGHYGTWVDQEPGSMGASLEPGG